MHLILIKKLFKYNHYFFNNFEMHLPKYFYLYLKVDGIEDTYPTRYTLAHLPSFANIERKCEVIKRKWIW